MAQAQYADPADLAAKQAARAARIAAGAPNVPSIQPGAAPSAPQAVSNVQPAYGNQAIADKVANIGNRAQQFRQTVQAGDIQAQTARIPGLQAPTGSVSDINARPTPSIAPTDVSTADMARAAPDSALARRQPGAAFEQPNAAASLSPDDLARANRGAARVTGANTAAVPADAPSAFGQATGSAAAPSIEPAVATAATEAAGASRVGGVLSRIGGLARGTAGALGRGAGYLGIGLEGAQAGSDALQGHTGDAIKGGLQTGLDVAAMRAPNPYTIGAAVVGHGVDYAVNDTKVGQSAMQGIANVLPGSGARATDAQVSDLEATMADRQRRGLPIPADYADKLASLKGQATDVRGGTSVDPSQKTVAQLVDPNAGRVPLTEAQSLDPNAPKKTPPINFITPETNGPISPPDASGNQLTGAGQAMKSDVPGTAVINGHVLSQKEIADAGNRLNTVSSSAFTNASTGDLYAQSHGGATPSSAEAQAFRDQLNGGGGKMFGNPSDLARANLLSDAQTQQANRSRQMTRLTSMSEAALASGKKRAAGILANLAGQYNDNPNPAAYLPQQPRQTTPGEAALEAAQAQNYAASADDTEQQVDQRRRVASITDQIAGESDPKKVAALQSQLAGLTGKYGGEKGITVDVPSQDLDANGVPIKYQVIVNPANGQVIYDPRGTQQQQQSAGKPKTPSIAG